ncbi:hypothetical protein HU200_066055 [Digitaria exilis]|uniref:F-box domain-containing protein n=1 Tax=Digitaria exilis TaxID=1010633 RepID=A0A834ZYZ7_9POAL|nr:hypothetical protein HU200_066055 [Digitaria exilis]
MSDGRAHRDWVAAANERYYEGKYNGDDASRPLYDPFPSSPSSRGSDESRAIFPLRHSAHSILVLVGDSGPEAKATGGPASALEQMRFGRGGEVQGDGVKAALLRPAASWPRSCRPAPRIRGASKAAQKLVVSGVLLAFHLLPEYKPLHSNSNRASRIADTEAPSTGLKLPDEVMTEVLLHLPVGVGIGAATVLGCGGRRAWSLEVAPGARVWQSPRAEGVASVAWRLAQARLAGWRVWGPAPSGAAGGAAAAGAWQLRARGEGETGSGSRLYLPVRSILCFRAVCRAWAASLSSDDFCSLHKARASSSAQPSLLLVAPTTAACDATAVYASSSPGATSLMLTLDGLKRVTSAAASSSSTTRWLRRTTSSTRPPVTRLPPCDEDELDSSAGLGFDTRAKEYKVIRLVKKPNDASGMVIAGEKNGMRPGRPRPRYDPRSAHEAMTHAHDLEIGSARLRLQCRKLRAVSRRGGGTLPDRKSQRGYHGNRRAYHKGNCNTQQTAAQQSLARPLSPTGGAHLSAPLPPRSLPLPARPHALSSPADSLTPLGHANRMTLPSPASRASPAAPREPSRSRSHALHTPCCPRRSLGCTPRVHAGFTSHRRRPSRHKPLPTPPGRPRTLAVVYKYPCAFPSNPSHQFGVFPLSTRRHRRRRRRRERRKEDGEGHGKEVPCRCLEPSRSSQRRHDDCATPPPDLNAGDEHRPRAAPLPHACLHRLATAPSITLHNLALLFQAQGEPFPRRAFALLRRLTLSQNPYPVCSAIVPLAGAPRMHLLALDATVGAGCRCPASTPSRRAMPATEPRRDASPRSHTHSCTMRWLAHVNAHMHARTRDRSARSPAFGHAVAAFRRTPGRHAHGRSPFAHGRWPQGIAALPQQIPGPRLMQGQAGMGRISAHRPSQARGAGLTTGAHLSHDAMMTSAGHVSRCEALTEEDHFTEQDDYPHSLRFTPDCFFEFP